MESWYGPLLESGAKRMPRNVYLYFCLCLLAAALYHLAIWPIAGTDTDLWYHLNGGRYFCETGSVSRTSFFSFIIPERPWTNYYWLFQVVLFRIFLWSGYTGLIFFRTLLFCATLLTLLFYLCRGKKEGDALLYSSILFVFYVLLFLPRSLPVRPHLFSYLFIVIFLYILEFKPRGARWLLPPLAALWSNLHGVEYPVMLLVLGGYFLEFVRHQMKKHRNTPGSETYVYPFLLVLSAGAILFTPHGFKLLKVPFTSIAHISPFVYELRPLSLYDFISFFGVLFFLAGLVAVHSIRHGKMRISHLFLFLGGIILLLKGKRFVNEYALLALPLLSGHIPAIAAPPRARVLKPIATALSVVFMAMPFFFMHYFFSLPPRYPVSARELPEGVTLFLKRANGTGSILNHPNTGGYLEWELYPRHKIFMDMQVPFLFTEGDFKTVRGAYADPRTLREVIGRYKPIFITAPIEMEGFKALIADHPQYRPIFFDDAEVLYVDGSREPVLASQYEMRSIDPFSLHSEPVRGGPLDLQVLEELLRLRKVYPAGGVVNAAIVLIYQRQSWYREAIPYAESIISTYPESHLGYKLKADLLLQLRAREEARGLYKKARDRSDGAMKQLIEMKVRDTRGID
jgi:hypothetical protein